MGGRETRVSNNEHRILNGEAEIGGVVRGGWFNRFLDKLGMTRAALGMTRTGDGNLALDGGEKKEFRIQNVE